MYCVCAANLMVGPEMHYNGLIRCGIANGSSPGLGHVVETRQSQGALELALQANKRIAHAYTSYGIERTKDQRVLKTT